MKDCLQTEGQSIFDHGVSVQQHALDLIYFLETGENKNKYPLPDFIINYRQQIIDRLLPLEIIKEYTLFHDIGKPFCQVIDENGKRHFPDHANISYSKYLEIGGSQEVASLIKRDMDIHVLKDKDVPEFSQGKEAITLLLVGLAEVLSNSRLFGGYNSISFKIKYKHLSKRGNAIIKKVLENDRKK